MFRLIAVVAALLVPSLAPSRAPAQELSGLARLDAAQSQITAQGDDLAVTLAISQPVPWRARLMDAPARLILDFREVDWANLADMPVDADAIAGLRAGVFRPAWSRLVIALNGPMAITRSEMDTGSGAAVVRLSLTPTTQDAFAAQAAQPQPAEWQPPTPADLPAPARSGSGPLVVVLDPGHGGLDPGAQRGGVNEADIVLTFAREFKELLLRDGGYSVVLTRDQDVFVPLEARISIARAAAADVFISLHADAVSEGEALGATIYSLSNEASDKASQTLAERHDRDDLLAGVDLTAQDDLVAQVLMDMARTSTAPRIRRLSAHLAQAIQSQQIKMHRHPEQSAGFSVLKSPDIPSVLVELGFLSSPRDVTNLTDPAWRARMALALQKGLAAWTREDRLLRAAPLQ